ncbi:hypothetical protein NBRC116588_02670 [Pyruvatibacter sp. HU-CL02332]|uniref:hypothetical protein n=1 Tax=Pyruvatibacter sp. HU-CL02332 TaxID=3127650 RepID=UPI00310ADCBF
MPDRPLKRPLLARPLNGPQDGEKSDATSQNRDPQTAGLRPTVSDFGDPKKSATPPKQQVNEPAAPPASPKPAAKPTGQTENQPDDTDEELFERRIVPEPATRQRKAPVRMRGPRKPSPMPLYLGAIASAFWTGIMFAYAVGYYGPGGLLILPPVDVALLAAALFAPLAIIWGFASIMWWGAQMRSSAEHMAEASRALLSPVETSAAATASVGHAVSTEMRRMERTLKQAEVRAMELRKTINGELNGLEAASARAEMRARTLRDLIGTERKALIETGKALEQESASVVEATRSQVELVSGVTGRAAEQMTEAQAGMGRAGDYLSKTLEAVARSAKAVRENVESQADRLDATAEHAVVRAGELAISFADQSEALNQSARTLADDNERAVRSFAEQRETLDALAADLRERATQIETAIASHSDTINEALDTADAKAMGLGPRVTREAEKLTAAARDAASQIEQTTGLMESRAVDMQARVADATGHLSQAIDFSTKNVDASGERLQALLSNIGSSAQNAAKDMTSASDELGHRLEQLPDEASAQAERLRAVMGEQIGAIAAVAESVANALERMGPGPVSGSWPPADPLAQPSPTAFAPAASSDASPATPTKTETPTPNSDAKWRLGDVLSAARAREDRATNVPRAAHHIIETLQSLSIDIDRALEEEPQVELWKRYRDGERNVFTKRLASLKGKEPHSLIAERYQNNAEFRGDADRYMAQFETLLADAADKNPDGLLAETYMSSDIGKVYALLAEATGHVG